MAQAFTDRNAGRKILDVAVALNTQGPEAAYRLMAGASRLDRIGPAFATKFLYFADPGHHERRALILDGLIAEWLRANTALRVNAARWSQTQYDDYLRQMHEWAEALEVEPDAVELAIFQAMSESRGNQWAKTASGPLLDGSR